MYPISYALVRRAPPARWLSALGVQAYIKSHCSEIARMLLVRVDIISYSYESCDAGVPSGAHSKLVVYQVPNLKVHCTSSLCKNGTFVFVFGGYTCNQKKSIWGD